MGYRHSFINLINKLLKNSILRSLKLRLQMNFQLYDKQRQNFQGAEEALIMSLSNPSLVKQIGEVLNNSTQGDLTMLSNYQKFLS